VGGGHRQDATQFNENEISSPTVSLTSVLMGAAVAAHKGQHVMALDHKSAYLNAAMTGPDVFMLLTPDVSSLLMELRPETQPFLRPDKKIAVRLKKALYGCLQSALLWYNELSSTIERMGFQKNLYDPCSYRRVKNNIECTVLVYVDDLLMMSDTTAALHEVAAGLKSKYGGITTTEGKSHDYLGIRLDFNKPGEVSLSMSGYVKDLMKKFPIFEPSYTPAKADLFAIDKHSRVLGRERKDMYHSAVMTLHYLAKRVRPDILVSVSWYNGAY
jgi:Reverse transcriptase (RNA-dependent DNA polymerase)